MRRRLDQLLVERGLFATRSQAARAILAGEVRVAGRARPKPGERVPPDVEVTLVSPEPPYASRAGRKLAHALDRFRLEVRGLVCLDLGAATGGFTDVLLRRGARRVYAVDVGYGQLLWRLRQDPRVVVLERTNARRLDRSHVPEPVDFLTVDLSFIGLEKVLPAVAPLLRPGALGVALVKPQFEAGPEKVGAGGVVRDAAVHREVLTRIVASLPAWGLRPLALAASPIRGQDGNAEFLLAFCREERERPPEEAPCASSPPARATDDWARAIEAALAEVPPA
ncbi:MAG: TlyA family RNA methyltransferase [Clostridia bacterium]|nr:TlyA family RNA methyltransferase [Clostridia bacterium]